MILAAFSIVLGNGYAARGSEAGRFIVWLFQILLWGAMFLSLTRFRFNNGRYAALANACGVAGIIALGFMQHFALGVPVSEWQSDIIIMVLAYVAFFGGLICLLSVIVLIKGIDSYAPDAFAFLPSADTLGLGWIFSWKFLQYLVIAVSGSIVGDMIMKRKSDMSGEQHMKSDIWLAVLALATVIFQLWGLFTRHVTADFIVSAVSAVIFIVLTRKNKALWSDITALGIPAQDTTYSAATASKAGLMSAEDKNKLDNISNHINPYASLSTKKLTLPLPYLFDAQTGNLMQGKYSGFEFTTFLDAINDVDINQEQLLFKALTTSDAYNARFYISIVPEKSSLKIWDSKSQEIYAYINNAGMFSVGNDHISLQVRNGGAVYFQHTLTQYVCIKGFMTFRVLMDDNLNN